MNRLMLTVAVGSTALLAACGGGEVVVQAQIQNEQGQAVPLPGLEIRALPYDRDVIFDSLAAAYTRPEPEISPELQSLQDSIAAANAAYINAEAEWATLRDSLQTLTETMEGMNPASGQYRVLFGLYNELAPQERQLERASRTAFQRFTGLQSRFTTQWDSVGNARAAWADAAYSDIMDVIAARERELRLEEARDTTNENGLAYFTNLKEGQWWIHARYELPFTELYWNELVDVGGGEPIQVQLTRENAEVRPKF